MEFYTSVHPLGDKILVRGYDKGRAYQRKVDFYPTLFVTSKKQSKWKTLDDTYVDEVKPGTIKDTREFVKRYEDVEGFAVYGNTNYAYQYISDTYQDDVNWDMEQIKVFTIDIETATENGFPDIRSANEEILLITIKNLQTKNIITFGTKPYENKREDCQYVYCRDEQQLLKEFIIWWQQNYPDCITGWNTDFFDVPYLIKRLDRELGDSFSKKVSPWGYINERKTFIKGNEELHYDILGISQLDYLELYKKYKGDGFTIMSVSFDTDKEKWKSAIIADKLTWSNHVSDLGGWNSKVGKIYKVNSVPFTVLIDKDGKIIKLNLRGEALSNELLQIYGH